MNTEKIAKQIKTKMTLVTPAKANRWLSKNNTNNRHLRENAVSRLASDMSAGRWLMTHQGIAFNCDGTLLDGQHRLAAIAKSGTSHWMPVTIGLPRESVSAIDDHQKRSVGDSLAIVHGISVPNVNRVTAAALWVEAGWKGDTSYRTTSRQQRIAIFQKHQDALAWATAAFPTNSAGLGRAAVLAVIARAYYTQPRRKVEQFCALLSDPSSCDVVDRSVLKLRDWLMTSHSAGWQAQLETFRKTERVLAAFITGESLSKITEASKELFPLPGEKHSK